MASPGVLARCVDDVALMMRVYTSPAARRRDVIALATTTAARALLEASRGPAAAEDLALLGIDVRR